MDDTLAPSPPRTSAVLRTILGDAQRRLSDAMRTLRLAHSMHDAYQIAIALADLEVCSLSLEAALVEAWKP